MNMITMFIVSLLSKGVLLIAITGNDILYALLDQFAINRPIYKNKF